MIKCWCLPYQLIVDKCHYEDYKNAPMCWRVLINLQAKNPGGKLNKNWYVWRVRFWAPLKGRQLSPNLNCYQATEARRHGHGQAQLVDEDVAGILRGVHCPQHQIWYLIFTFLILHFTFYSKVSTVHGISYVFSRAIPQVDRLLWTILTVTG